MKPKYETLAIVPSMIASTVLYEIYTGQEISNKNISQAQVDKVETERRLLTPAEQQEFIRLVNKRCKDAYNADAAWMMKIVRSNSNRGRDTLYNFVRHWLSSFCVSREIFYKNCGISADILGVNL